MKSFNIYALFAKKNQYEIHFCKSERMYVYTRTVEYKGTLYIPESHFSFDLDPIWFADAPSSPRGDLQVINNDFKRQPRIRRGQIDTIDQAMEKWLWRTSGWLSSVQ